MQIAVPTTRMRCSKGKYDLATVEYLYNLYPDAIQEPITVEVDGWPILLYYKLHV